MRTRPEISAFCKEYLEKKELFKWFIERYFGLPKYMDLWKLAEDNQEEHLRNELDAIWFSLPDNIFNIQNNPPGWEAFINLIDE